MNFTDVKSLGVPAMAQWVKDPGCCSCSLDSSPGPGTSICCGCNQNKSINKCLIKEAALTPPCEMILSWQVEFLSSTNPGLQTVCRAASRCFQHHPEMHTRMSAQPTGVQHNPLGCTTHSPRMGTLRGSQKTPGGEPGSARTSWARAP